MNEYEKNAEELIGSIASIISNMQNAVNDITAQLKEYDKAQLQTILCMVLEEYCFDHELSMVETIKEMYDTARNINEVFGAYVRA